MTLQPLMLACRLAESGVALQFLPRGFNFRFWEFQESGKKPSCKARLISHEAHEVHES